MPATRSIVIERNVQGKSIGIINHVRMSQFKSRQEYHAAKRVACKHVVR